MTLAISTGVPQISVSQEQTETGKKAYLLTIDGAIGPAVSDYVIEGLDKAKEKKAEVVILQMDTPGGLDTSMRAIIKAILTSPVPVVGYVAPEGARAASAGTYILYASHVAAMAPATNLGAATPVSIGGLPGMEPESPEDTSNKNKRQEKSEGKPSNQEAMRAKAIEDATAYLKSLAQKRGRNVEWAEKAVTQAKSLTAEEALQKNVIDLIAPNPEVLLKEINGRPVEVLEQEKILQTAVGNQTIRVVEIQPDWKDKLFQVLSNPNLAYILLMVGIYGIIFELMHPGSLYPGVLGAIALLLALYSLHLLPINYTGLAFLILGVILMVAEAFVPSFGALGLGGIVAFILGSFMLLDTPKFPGLSLAKPLIFSVAAVSGVFFIGVIGMAIKARRRKVVSGAEEMIGAVGEVIQFKEHQGEAMIHGELWKIHSSSPLQMGSKVKVLSREGLVLQVEPYNQ